MTKRGQKQTTRTGWCAADYQRELLERSVEDDAAQRERAGTERELEQPCRLWTGSLNGNGYGRHAVIDEQLAHRVSYRAFRTDLEAIPLGMQILHECDVPRCIEPSHLTIGSHQDNMTDIASKGRGNNGQLGTRASPERRAQTASSLRGNKNALGRKRTDDFKAKLSASMKATWARRRAGARHEQLPGT